MTDIASVYLDFHYPGGVNVIVEGMHSPLTPANSTDSSEINPDMDIRHTTDTIHMTVSCVY